MTTPQEQVAENTKARGYRDGWTVEQFAARQVCKLVEELGELILNIWSSTEYAEVRDWEEFIVQAKDAAKEHFDDQLGWENPNIISAKDAKLELADIQVVVFNLAAALAEITGEPYDVVQAAVDKSAADVDRGVR